MKHPFPLRRAAALVLALAASPVVAEVAVDLRADVGYDSNVFNLNDTVGEEAGMFTDLDAGVAAERTGKSGWTTGFDAGVDARLFESAVNDGDQAKYFLRLRGDSGGARREHDIHWAVRYRMQDSTYVSRFTGRVATSGGTPIGDRYDAGIADVRGGWKLPGGGYGRLSFDAFLEAKDYRDDYAALGLDRLDYNQYGVEPAYEVGSRTDTVRFALPVAQRQYRDRRVSDVDGNAVAGTDLEYTYYGVDASYEHAFSRASALQVSAGYEDRQDNGVGFGDRTRWGTGVEWTYRTPGKTRFDTGVEWSSRTLNNTSPADPTVVDETPDKDGYTVNARLQTPFPGVKARDFLLLARAAWESFDSSNEVRYSYDRLETFVGVRKEF